MFFCLFTIVFLVFFSLYCNYQSSKKLLEKAEAVASEQIISDFGSEFNLVASKYVAKRKCYSVAFLDDSKNHFVNYRVKNNGNDWFAEWYVDCTGTIAKDKIKSMYSNNIFERDKGDEFGSYW